MKIGIIGAGNMGSAMARGIAAGSVIDATDVYVANPSQPALDALKQFDERINTTTNNEEVVAECDVVILAVKPWLVEPVVKQVKNVVNPRKQIIVSIAAGVSLHDLEALFDYNHTGIYTLYRVIPNIAIEVKESVNTISALNTKPDQDEMILRVFNELGKSYLVPESQLNALMSLSSCGIAYALRYIRAAMVGGVEMGVAASLSKEIVTQTLRGAIELLEANNSHPEVEIDKVTTPGGITIKGLNAMEADGFTASVVAGLKASLLSK